MDNQKLQRGAATILGVKDESDQADAIARQWASENNYSDSEEDTLRHILLGGFMQSVKGEGLGRVGKGIAGKLINVRESTDEESLIDIDNNNFGRQLRKELINKDKDSSVEGFVEAAKNFVHSLRTEEEVRDVDGLRPRMSTAGMSEGGLVNNITNQMKIFNENTVEPTIEPLTPVAYTPEEFDGEDKSKDGFLDTAFENAKTPLLEAKDLFLSAGSGAVFDTLKTKDDPRLLHALARVNDYIAGTGYAGWKTGEAAVGFVLGALADFIGQDEGEPLAGILGTESQANRMLYSMPESFAGSAGTRSLTVLDDALDSLPQAVSMLATKLPLIKADLSGSLKSLAQGDLQFLKESPNPPKSLSASVVGNNQVNRRVDSDDPGINPTKPKSQVAPIVRDSDADVNLPKGPWQGDFYSPIIANLDNLAIGPEGMLGSNIVKFLTNKASNINKTELNWSQLLFPGRRITDRDNPELLQGEIPFLGIDPKRKYTKSEIKELAIANLPRIEIKTLESFEVPYEDVQRIPVLIGKNSENAPLGVAPGNTQIDIEDGNYEDIIQTGIRNLDPTLSIEDRRQYVIDTWRANRPIFLPYAEQTATGRDYQELLLINRNTLGNEYKKAKGHYPDIDGSEGTVAHSRGGYYTLPKGRKIFVLEEMQSDAAQTSKNKPSTIASEETTKQTQNFLERQKLGASIEGPKLGSIENEEVLANKLSELILKNVNAQNSTLPSNRFDRFAGIKSGDPFAAEKTKEALLEISFDVNEVQRTFDEAIAIGTDTIDARNKVVRYLIDKYDAYGISINSLERGTKNILQNGPDSLSETRQEVVNKILSNFVGDLIYTKGVVRRDFEISDNINNIISSKIPPIKPPELNLSPVKLSETVRMNILAAMKSARSRGTDTIVIPPLKDIIKAHDSKQKPSQATYVDAVAKVLKSLKSETNGKINFKMGKIEDLDFESGGNYTVINFKDFKIPNTSQLRLAEGGVVVPMEQELQMQNMLQQGGIRDDGMNIDPVSGNEVPSGSLASEVRDDIPAQLSEGEYVVPADVVRYFGVRVFEEMRMEAKQGLQTMEENGRIGGEPIQSPDQMPTNPDQISDADLLELEKMLSPQGMADGGLVQGAMIDKLIMAAQTDPLVNQRMSANGVPIKMAVGGAVGQQAPTSSLYSDPKKIDEIISKISSAASQNPQLMRMLGERGINVPTNLATQTPEQIQEQNSATGVATSAIEPPAGFAAGGYNETLATSSTNLPANYLIPGAMTQGAVGSGQPFGTGVITPEPEVVTAVGGFNPTVSNSPLPACPPGQERNAAGICVPRQDYDGSKKGGETVIPDPWYTGEDMTDITDWAANKLSGEEETMGLGNLLSNIPIVKKMQNLNKYNNISEARAGATLALAAGKIDQTEFDKITGQVDDYIKSEGLNRDIANTFFTGSLTANSTTKQFAGEDGTWSDDEWNNFVTASGGAVDTSSSSSSSKSTPKVYPGDKGIPVLTTSAQRSRNDDRSGKAADAARERASNIAKKAKESGKSIASIGRTASPSGNKKTAEQNKNKDGFDPRGNQMKNKGGLMTKNKK